MQGSNASTPNHFSTSLSIINQDQIVQRHHINLSRLLLHSTNYFRYFTENKIANTLICLIVSILPRFWFPATACSNQTAVIGQPLLLFLTFSRNYNNKTSYPTHTPAR